MGRSGIRAVLAAATVATLFTGAGGAQAAVPASLDDPANCERVDPAPGYKAYRCDDGVPPTGGRTANEGGVDAVTVPARYERSAFVGLPDRAASSAGVPGADSSGDIALDVDVTVPGVPATRDGYPILFFMHGCCGGDKTSWEADSIDAPGQRWHYNDAWFASRGYLVVSFTARGFVNGAGRGSTGETQLDHRSFEINDYQHLACQILAAAPRFSDVSGHPVTVDPGRVVVTGGSYGGGFSWMAATDPEWTCSADTGAGGKRMKLAAAAPKFGWTDLVQSLLPTGRHFQTPDRLPATDGCDSAPVDLAGRPCGGGAVLGTPKASIVAGLYASGKSGIGPNAPHTTFSDEIDEVFACTTAYPPTPLCEATMLDAVPNFTNGRSAYYQRRFFERIKSDPGFRTPIFNAATNTDPLFPPAENRRMANRLLKTVPRYPIQTYHGDYQHFTQDKPTEWGDLCGADGHVCTAADYPPGSYDAKPAGLDRTGATTRLNRFVDHYAKPRLNANEPVPDFDVTTALQVCPQIAGGRPDLPGRQYTAPSFEQLTRGFLDLDLAGSQTTTSTAAPNRHAADADPVGNSLTNGGACAVEKSGAGAGVATYDSDPLERKRTMIGATRVTVDFSASAGARAVELNARLYDVLPGGTALLVDRGPRVLTPGELGAGRVEFELHGNSWAFGPGHRIRIELAQDDEPFVRASSVSSSLTLDDVQLVLPVREQAKGRCKNVRTGDAFDNRHLDGGIRGDRIKGRRGDDRIRGRRGRDCLNGGGGRDLVLGGAGRDKVTGGPGRDALVGGNGPDRIMARDGVRDKVVCGRGRDLVKADRKDRLIGCERVIHHRGKRRR